MFSSCSNAGSDTDVTNDYATTITTSQATSSTDRAMPVYYDLQTRQPIEVAQDENSRQYADVSTHKPLVFYYDPISLDTFDSRGRLVNNALILTNGDYSLDEAKIKSNDDAFKIKTDEMKMKIEKDGDMKIKTDGMKIKDKDGKYKEKTVSAKIKVKDGKVKIKKD